MFKYADMVEADIMDALKDTPPLAIVCALKRAGVSAEYFRGALIVYTRRHVAAVGLYGFDVSSYADICGFSDIDIMAASVAGRL